MKNTASNNVMYNENLPCSHCTSEKSQLTDYNDILCTKPDLLKMPKTIAKKERKRTCRKNNKEETNRTRAFNEKHRKTRFINERQKEKEELLKLSRVSYEYDFKEINKLIDHELNNLFIDKNTKITFVDERTIGLINEENEMALTTLTNNFKKSKGKLKCQINKNVKFVEKFKNDTIKLSLPTIDDFFNTETNYLCLEKCSNNNKISQSKKKIARKRSSDRVYSSEYAPPQVDTKVSIPSSRTLRKRLHDRCREKSPRKVEVTCGDSEDDFSTDDIVEERTSKEKTKPTKMKIIIKRTDNNLSLDENQFLSQNVEKAKKQTNVKAIYPEKSLAESNRAMNGIRELMSISQDMCRVVEDPITQTKNNDLVLKLKEKLIWVESDSESDDAIDEVITDGIDFSVIPSSKNTTDGTEMCPVKNPVSNKSSSAENYKLRSSEQNVSNGLNKQMQQMNNDQSVKMTSLQSSRISSEECLRQKINIENLTTLTAPPSPQIEVLQTDVTQTTSSLQAINQLLKQPAQTSLEHPIHGQPSPQQPTPPHSPLILSPTKKEAEEQEMLRDHYKITQKAWCSAVERYVMRCESCNKTFTSPSTLISHLSTCVYDLHHLHWSRIKHDVMRCPECRHHLPLHEYGAHYSTMHGLLVFYLKSVCRENKCRCQNYTCRVLLGTIESCVLHYRKCKYLWKCPTCHVTFKTKRNTEEHKRKACYKIQNELVF